MKKTLIIAAALSSLFAGYTWAAKAASAPSVSTYPAPASAQGKADASAASTQGVDAGQMPAAQ